MSNLSFQPVSNGLYSAIDSTQKKVSVYWLALGSVAPPAAGNQDVMDLWNQYAGCFIFMPSGAAIPNVGTFVTAVKANLKLSTQANSRWAAWVADPVAAVGPAVSANTYDNNGQVYATTIPSLTLPFVNIAISVPSGTTLFIGANQNLLPDGSMALFFQGSSIAVTRAGYSVNMPPANGLVALPLNGPLAGVMRFDGLWQRDDFYTFMTDDPGSFDNSNTNEIRYFYGAKGSEQFLHYPVFPPPPQSPDPKWQLALNVTMDPLNVLDSSQTRFGLDVAAFQFPKPGPAHHKLP